MTAYKTGLLLLYALDTHNKFWVMLQLSVSVTDLGNMRENNCNTATIMTPCSRITSSQVSHISSGLTNPMDDREDRQRVQLSLHVTNRISELTQFVKRNQYLFIRQSMCVSELLGDAVEYLLTIQSQSKHRYYSDPQHTIKCKINENLATYETFVNRKHFFAFEADADKIGQVLCF